MLREHSDRPSASSTDSRSEVSRLRLLAGILESFTSTIDFEQVLRRIVEITREEFKADRAWLLFPANLEAEFATVSFEATRPEYPGAFSRNVRIPLAPSRALIQRGLERKAPFAVYENDPAADPELWRAFQIRSQLLQIVET